MAENGWSRAFDDPIPLPGGGQLITLRDAANYITKLHKAKHNAPKRQAVSLSRAVHMPFLISRRR
jgi:hypothetical protein